MSAGSPTVWFTFGTDRKADDEGDTVHLHAGVPPNTYEDSSRQETKISSTLKNRTTRKSANKKYSRRSRYPTARFKFWFTSSSQTAGLTTARNVFACL